MIIEHAERFGLAQLHQLRGRVGRGTEKSTCILLRSDQVNDVARARLNILRESEDGFLIAEEDLHLRGSGEMLGTRQSGLPNFRLVDFEAHSDLIEMARDDARHAGAKQCGNIPMDAQIVGSIQTGARPCDTCYICLNGMKVSG